jgi:hypothetical protein
MKDRVYDDLQALRQKSSVQSYVTKFTQHCARLSLSEESKINTFRRGLKPEIQRFLLSTPDSLLSLSSATAAAIRYDDQLFAMDRALSGSRGVSDRNSDSSLSRGSGPKSRVFPSSTPSSSSSSTVPGTATRGRGPLLPAERARRIAGGLCIFCGNLDCPGVGNTENCAILVKRNAGKVVAGRE